ncbi:hypothetical protein [Novosphingobium fuchskuhlense]|uniref:hypothetical protein n=1 Tax=Novosphingobium fuchskuhlense TaxID=1117702 RepID=UPI000AE2B9B9|nr:hypothetical protein [Novosphingobium fuchskuhlense]
MTKTNEIKRLATVLACAAVFALSACGKTDDASAGATADNVEMPADELPSAEPSAAAPAPAADASQAALSAEDAAKSAADSAVSAAEEAKAAAAAAAEEQKPQQ